MSAMSFPAITSAGEIAIVRPVMVCPTCFGVSTDIAMHECPECETELLARVPIRPHLRHAVHATRLTQV